MNSLKGKTFSPSFLAIPVGWSVFLREASNQRVEGIYCHAYGMKVFVPQYLANMKATL
jgi:pyruvate/2-oxoglutarate/acetoin dehydrogenase E1 component